MNFLIAPNALKGSLSASNAAVIISKAIQTSSPDAHCILSPISDGGDGTLDCLVQGTGGKFYSARVCGPLDSMTVNARWGVLGDGTTAVIEMAEAAGLHLLRPNQYDAVHATTFGVGELIRKAIDGGYQKIIVGMGGSATNDGGAGCARAIGVKFFDMQNMELPDGGIHLSRLHHIEIENIDNKIRQTEIIGLSDVTNLLCGPEGAAYTFASQKGATEKQMRILDGALEHYASIIMRDLQKNVSDLSGSGAAGGFGAGLIAFCNAKILSGIDFVLDTLHFDNFLQQCDCVITAEGTLDSQTLHGKGMEGIVRRANKFNKPVHAFVGKILGEKAFLKEKLGLASLHQISPGDMPTEKAMRDVELFLSKGVQDYFSPTTSEK